MKRGKRNVGGVEPPGLVWTNVRNLPNRGTGITAAEYGEVVAYLADQTERTGQVCVFCASGAELRRGVITTPGADIVFSLCPRCARAFDGGGLHHEISEPVILAIRRWTRGDNPAPRSAA